MFFLVLVYVFNFNLFEFLTTILEKGLLFRLVHIVQYGRAIPQLESRGKGKGPYFMRVTRDSELELLINLLRFEEKCVFPPIR